MSTYLRSAALLAMMILSVFAFVNADKADCDPDPVEILCEYDGEMYAQGETFPSTDGCNTCTCMDNGLVACTLMACGCMVDDSFHLVGESFPADDGCNTCTCVAPGEVACTEMACGCEYDGTWHAEGESFPATDGCNTCTCMAGGGVACTLMACGCLVGGSFYAYDEAHWSMDACNVCFCMPAGSACTKMYCPCQGDEWFRDYASTDLTECADLSVECPANTHSFQNDCGCGCQQSPDCDAVYDCEPPTDCSDLFATCPYSTFAL